MNIIFGNFGAGTIALIQWAYENKLPDVLVVSIETSWADEAWADTVEKCESYSRSCGFNVERIKPPESFSEYVLERKSFPNYKFQTCAIHLKGLTFLSYLNKKDPECKATILLGRRRVDSQLSADLPETVESSSHYGERKLWHPLYTHGEKGFLELIDKTGLDIISRSLECNPCIHFPNASVRSDRLENLEKKVGEAMFSSKDKEYAGANKLTRDAYDRGCGSSAIYVCGL